MTSPQRPHPSQSPSIGVPEGDVARVRNATARAYTRARALGARIRARVTGAHVHLYEGQTWDHFILPNGDTSRGAYMVCECGHEDSYAIIYRSTSGNPLPIHQSPAHLIPFAPWVPPPPEVLPWHQPSAS